MDLIYVWIEKFRNIEQCGIRLSKDFLVTIKNCGINEKDNISISVKEIIVKKISESPNIYGDNVININAIVGKNGVGKSNFLTCIGELVTSFHESSFILIYYNREKKNMFWNVIKLP